MLENEDDEADQNRRNRRYSVHPLFVVRSRHGEFHHLYCDLRRHPDRFFEFMRMSVQTFDFILAKVETHLLRKKTCMVPITPAERLYVTIR